jgi:uncharacterized protein (TIGR02246 family)
LTNTLTDAQEGAMDAFQVAAEIGDGFAVAWNQHDMQALGRLFDDDAEFVNVVGVQMRGREAIEGGHGAAHAGPYRNSTLRVTVDDAREIVPGAIVAHLLTQLESDARVPGETRRTVMTLVLEQRAAEWKILAAHNTGIAAPAN